MGNNSISKIDSRKKDLTDAEWELQVLGFSDLDITKLRKIFDRARPNPDVDESDLTRILTNFGMESNKLIRHAFSMIESSKNMISFRDMIVMLYYFSTTVGDVPLALFVFEMFDSDHNGLLDYNEFDDMMSAVFGAKRPMGGVLKLLQDEILARKNEGEIGVSRHFFASFSRENPLLLREVELLQKHVKTATRLPSKSWKNCRIQRKELLGDEGAEDEEIVEDLESVYVSFRRFDRNLQRGLYTHSPDAVDERDTIDYQISKDAVDQPATLNSSGGGGAWKSAQPTAMTLADFSPNYQRRSASRQNSYSSATSGGETDNTNKEVKETVKSHLKKAQRRSLSRHGSATSVVSVSRHNSVNSVGSFDSAGSGGYF